MIISSLDEPDTLVFGLWGCSDAAHHYAHQCPHDADQCPVVKSRCAHARLNQRKTGIMHLHDPRHFDFSRTLRLFSKGHCGGAGGVDPDASAGGVIIPGEPAGVASGVIGAEAGGVANGDGVIEDDVPPDAPEVPPSVIEPLPLRGDIDAPDIDPLAEACWSDF